MALTDAQIAILAADITANSGVGGDFEGVPNTPDGHFVIRDAYNATAVPQFVVWRPDVTVAEVKEALDWVEYVGAVDALDHNAFTLMTSNGIVDASDANVRAGLAEIFKGPQKENTRTALLAIGKLDATRAERLFATGTGSDASPATMTHEGAISLQDVARARSS